MNKVKIIKIIIKEINDELELEEIERKDLDGVGVDGVLMGDVGVDGVLMGDVGVDEVVMGDVGVLMGDVGVVGEVDEGKDLGVDFEAQTSYPQIKNFLSYLLLDILGKVSMKYKKNLN